jgi:hypothetical protein
MPRTEDVLTIFLATPGDVTDERARFADVISDWNRAWSRDLGLRLDLVRWEDDAYPAIGDDAQDVINQQLPADYDLFVGLMWSRFGTPTGRAGSGTKEEFDRAIERYRRNPSELDILFYFKDAPIAPSKVEPEQLAKVQEFKCMLSGAGVLTWDFTDVEQFEKLVALHITKHVQAWRKARDVGTSAGKSIVPKSTRPELPQLPVGEEDQDDSGYLDLLETFAECSTEMGEIAERLTLAQQELTEHMNKGTKELDALKADRNRLSPAQFRGALSRVADDMLRFTHRVEAEVPLFRAAVNNGMAALVKAATLTAELYPERTASTKAAAVQLLTTLTSARESTEGFKTSTARLPRMTKELNVAKRKQVAALESLVAEFLNGERLLAEALSVIDGLSDGEPAQVDQ